MAGSFHPADFAQGYVPFEGMTKSTSASLQAQARGHECPGANPEALQCFPDRPVPTSIPTSMSFLELKKDESPITSSNNLILDTWQ
jgi:hypothetical protein